MSWLVTIPYLEGIPRRRPTESLRRVYILQMAATDIQQISPRQECAWFSNSGAGSLSPIEPQPIYSSAPEPSDRVFTAEMIRKTVVLW
jgi:hypothetical protein